jgi:nucleoside-diphosphate-sugar epimerase
MRILLTGATGYVGRRLAEALIARGDVVLGLVRNSDRAAVLPAGAEPIVGRLEDRGWLDLLEGVDALVHTAFPQHGVAWDEGVDIEAAFLRDAVERLKGSDKTLIVTNGTIFLGDSGSRRLDESAPVLRQNPASGRAEATRVVTEARGLRGVELRHASFVYGNGGGGFLPMLIAAARATGRALYVGDGEIATSSVHVDAAVQAYLNALDSASAGSTFHIASEEEPSWRQIAEAVAHGIGGGCQAESATQEQVAAAFGPFTVMFMTTNNRLDARRARREIEWNHAGHVPLLWDVSAGSYVA